MKKQRVLYLGSFPPPYGGVTIKNQLLYEVLSSKLPISRVENKTIKIHNFNQVLGILAAIMSRQSIIIGVSSMGGKSLLLTKLLYSLNRSTMRRSVYFMMGGLEAKRIVGHRDEIRMYRNYRRIYVETMSMKKELEDAGLYNVGYFPNCRLKPKVPDVEDVADITDSKFRCVFFSRIDPMKGSEILLDTAANMPDIEFDFWGEITENYRQQFSQRIDKLRNTHYCGVFKGDNNEKCKKLKEYDVLIFPTCWKNEGVPGILIEAKMAGLPIIASDVAYNAELVKNGNEGIILESNTAEYLEEAIKELQGDKGMCKRLSYGSKTSAEAYYIENYVTELISVVGGVIPNIEHFSCLLYTSGKCATA